MGSVMSYSLGLGPDRPAPAGILAFSGFIPTVDDWEPQIPRPTAVFVAHGRADPIIDVDFARTAKQLLEDAGMNVDYHETDGGHTIDLPAIRPAAEWLKRVIP
jgi:phospholipase/carboxylesterase